jgi:hypothetical protein
MIAFAISEDTPQATATSGPKGSESVTEVGAAHSDADAFENLLGNKEWVDVGLAAQYLQMNQDHVRRLVRKGKLTRIGKGRPIKITTESIRQYHLT